MDHCCCFAGCKLVLFGKCMTHYCVTTFHICEPKENDASRSTE